MNCIIANDNVKVFVKVLKALSKVGFELVMEAYPDKLLLRCINSRSTGFAICKIVPSFFEEFNMTNGPDESGPFICKMLIKSVVGVFKNIKQMEKQIEKCAMECEPDSTNLTFKIQFKCKACKIHKIYLSEGVSWQVTTPSDDRPNIITSLTSPFVKILTNFQTTDEEITFDVSPDSVVVRNYTSLDPIASKFVRTQYTFDTAEFHTYNVSDTCNLTFPMKPFRACIQLADYVLAPVTMSFQKPGVPLVIEYSKSTLFYIAFTFATLSRPDEERALLNGISLGTPLPISYNNQPENVRQNSSWSSNDLSLLSLSDLKYKNSLLVSSNKSPTKKTINGSKKDDDFRQLAKLKKFTEREKLQLKRPEKATKKLQPFELLPCASKESDFFKKNEPSRKKIVDNAGEKSVVFAVNESDTSEHSSNMSLPLLKKQKTEKSDHCNLLFNPIADKNKIYEPKSKWIDCKRIEKKSTVRDDNEPQAEHGHKELGQSSEILMSDYVQKQKTINPPADRKDSTFHCHKITTKKPLKQILATWSPDMPLVVPSSIPENNPSQNVSNHEIDDKSSANLPLLHGVNRKQQTIVRPVEKPVNNINLDTVSSINENFNEYPPYRRVVPNTELQEISFGVTAEPPRTEEEKEAEFKKKDEYIKRIFACLLESPEKKEKIILCPDTSSDEDD